MNFISCQREFTTKWWQREKIKYIPVKPKLAPIWLNVKLKINAIFFFLPHPTRHGRYSCRGWEDSNRGRCKQGNWNSVTPYPLTILPGHLLMVAACTIDITSPADSRKPSHVAGCGKEEWVGWGNVMSGCDPLDFSFTCSRGLRPKTGLVSLVSCFLKITFLNLYPNLWILSMPHTQIVFCELVWDNTYNSEANFK